MKDMKKVITYQHAYVGGQTTLCDECAGKRLSNSGITWIPTEATEHFPSLGPVSHGAHDGACDWCDRDLDAADETLEQNDRRYALGSL